MSHGEWHRHAVPNLDGEIREHAVAQIDGVIEAHDRHARAGSRRVMLEDALPAEA